MEGAEKRREKLRKTARDLKKYRQQTDDFRVVIAGKGGAGKTTLAALLARLFDAEGYGVLAVDEDPQQNLAFSLGYPAKKASEIVPISRNLDYIEEKVGARPGEGWGVMINLNPDVSDVVDRFGMKVDEKIDLLVMGSVVQAATGCLCPENALLDAIVRSIKLRDDEVILMDTQAGVEHFGRNLAEGFRNAVIMAEPSFNAIQVAVHSAELADQMGIQHIYLVVNKVRSREDVEKVSKLVGESNFFHSIYYLPFDDEVYINEPDVSPLVEMDSPYTRAVKELLTDLKKANFKG